MKLFSGLEEAAVEVAADACRQDDIDGRYAEHPDEEGAQHGNPHVGPPNLGRLRHLERGGGDEGHHGWTDATEGAGHPLVVAKLLEEEGYGQDDEERGQAAAQRAHQRTTCAAELIADEDADIHRKDTGARLCHGHQVEQFVARDPVALVHHFGLDERYHGIAASDGEEADAEEGGEERQHPRPLVCAKGSGLCLTVGCLIHIDSVQLVVVACRCC